MALSTFTTDEAASGVANNLPREMTPLIGRQADTVTLRALLLDPAVPLITLTGPGGMGKTTLALHVASQLLADFPEGIHFVDLTPLSVPDLIPIRIAETLGLKASVGQSLEETLVDHYRQKKALLLLDNFEHLIDGGVIAAELLRHSAHLKILITSREAVRLRGERLYSLPPLTLPNPGQGVDVEAISRIAAVDLFVQRARAVRPGFALTAENAAAVAGIVARLDGLPLAIELAAARVRLFPPAVLLARLEASLLGILVGGTRDLPERQRTIRATIGWSVDLLEPPEARLFRRLGVFANGLTIEAAEAVAATAFADAIDILTGLESLLDKSLITRLPVEEEPRFGMLETPRAYALEQLAATGEELIACRAHFEYYLALAEAAAPHLRGPKQAAWLTLLAADENNLRAALGWSLDGLVDEEMRGLRLAGALGDFWYYGDRSIEGRRWLERALALPIGNEPPVKEQTAIRARALGAAGTMAWLQGNYDEARTYHEEALADYKAIDDRRGVADALNNLAAQYAYLLDYQKARGLYIESEALWREIGDDFQLACALNNRGCLESFDGHDHEARAFLEQALEIGVRIDSNYNILQTSSNLGQIELRSGRLERADELLRLAYDLAVRMNNTLIEIDVTLSLGRLREKQGRPREAWHLAVEALALAHKGEIRPYVADGLEQAAFALRKLGEPARPTWLLGAAAALRRRMDAPDSRDDPAYYNARLPAVRATLGEEAFAAAWDAGSRLSRDEAVALAMEEPAPALEAGLFPKNPASKTADPLAALTRREREVALLMVRGLTNEEIGRELFISVNTVEKHAGNALGKLGLRNRMELARWLATQDKAGHQKLGH